MISKNSNNNKRSQRKANSEQKISLGELSRIYQREDESRYNVEMSALSKIIDIYVVKYKQALKYSESKSQKKYNQIIDVIKSLEDSKARLFEMDKSGKIVVANQDIPDYLIRIDLKNAVLARKNETIEALKRSLDVLQLNLPEIYIPSKFKTAFKKDLLPYFVSDEDKKLFTQIIQGRKVEQKACMNISVQFFCKPFASLIDKKIILGYNNKSISKWIVSNFTCLRKNTKTNLNYNSIEKYMRSGGGVIATPSDIKNYPSFCKIWYPEKI